jgi:hypothetical protein
MQVSGSESAKLWRAVLSLCFWLPGGGFIRYLRFHQVFFQGGNVKKLLWAEALKKAQETGEPQHYGFRKGKAYPCGCYFIEVDGELKTSYCPEHKSNAEGD